MRLHLRVQFGQSRLFSNSGPKDSIPGWARHLGVKTQADWDKARSPQAKFFYAACAGTLVGCALLSSAAKEQYGVDISRYGSGQITPPRMVSEGESIAAYQQRLKDTKEWRASHPPPQKRGDESWTEYTDRLNRTWGQGKPS